MQFTLILIRIFHVEDSVLFMFQIEGIPNHTDVLFYHRDV